MPYGQPTDTAAWVACVCGGGHDEAVCVWGKETFSDRGRVIMTPAHSSSTAV